MSDLFRRWAWALRIDGVPIVYASRSDFPISTITALWPEGSPTIEVIPTLQPPGPLSDRGDLLGSVAQANAIDLTIGRGNGDSTDAFTVFGRLGVRSAGSWALMTGVILDPDDDADFAASLTSTATPPFDITLDRAYTPPAGGGSFVVHVGPEAMLASGADGSEVDPGGDPYRVRITHRGIGGSQEATHTVSIETRDQPIVQGPDATEWKRRTGVLLYATVDEAGDFEEPIELLRGFIESTPRPNAEGTAIQLTLAPLAARLRTELQIPPATAPLARGVHLHTEGVRDEIIVLEAYNALEGPAWTSITDEESLAGDGFIGVGNNAVARWEERFCVGLSYQHPRSGSISIPFGAEPEILGISAVAPGGDLSRFEVDSIEEGVVAPRAPVAIGTPVESTYGSPENAAARRIRFTDTGDGTRWLRWPGDPGDADDSAAGRINDALTGDHDQITGGWATVSFTPGVASPLRIASTTPLGVLLYFPITFPPTLDGVGGIQRAVLPDGRVLEGPALSPGRRAFGGIRWRPEGVDEVDGLQYGRVDRGWMYTAAAGNGGSARYAIGGIGRAFYHTGEPSIIIESPVDVSSGRIDLQIGLNAGGGRVYRPNIPCATTLRELVVPNIGSDLDGEVVYAIDLIEPDLVPTSIEWDYLDDDTRVVVKASRPAFATSGDLIYWLLTDPGHLNFDTASIDENGIKASAGDPAWITSWRLPDTEDPLSYEEVIAGICRITRTALVQRTLADGINRITRVPWGAESEARIAGGISAGDWAADPIPTWDTDDRIINAVSIRADYRRPRGQFDEDPEFQVDITVESKTSQRAYGEKVGEDIEVLVATGIRGSVEEVSVSGRSITAFYDSPRRIWKGRISTAQALALPLGSTVRVSSPHLLGYNGPAEEDLGVVVERSIDLAEEGAEITILHFGVRTGGWNNAFAVAAVVDATTVEVEELVYSDEVNISAGLPSNDLAGFFVGDAVICQPYADEGAAILNAIAVIDRDLLRVTFFEEHGLAAGDIVIPGEWDQASAHHKRFAYLAGPAEPEIENVYA